MLKNLILPGSHDSGTKDVSCAINPNSMAQCQDSTIMQQLELGVRFLDFYLKSDGSGDSATFYVYHGICDTKLTATEIVTDVNTYLERSGNEKEIVVMRFAKLQQLEWMNGAPMTTQMSKAQEDLLLKKLTTWNGQRNPKCAWRPKNAQGNRDIKSATNVTVNQLLAKGERIITLFDYVNSDPSTIENSYPVWCNREGDATNGLLVMDKVWKSYQHVDELVEQLAKWQKQFWCSESMFALQAILTVNGVPPGARSIRDFSEDSNQFLMDWIANHGIKSRLNVLLLNYVCQDFSRTWTNKDYVQMAIDLIPHQLIPGVSGPPCK